MAWATRRSTTTGPQEPRSAELFVHPDRAGLGKPVGLAGDPAGLPGRHLQPTYTFPEKGEAVAQVEGVGDQLCPGRADMPSANANGSGVNAATEVCRRRRATRPRAGWARQGSRCRCRWWRGGGRPSGRRAGACGTRPSLGLFGLGGGFEHAGRVEVADLVLLPGPWCSWVKPSIDHRQSRPRIPCIHRGFGHRDRLVIWPRSRCRSFAHGSRDGTSSLLDQRRRRSRHRVEPLPYPRRRGEQEVG